MDYKIGQNEHACYMPKHYTYIIRIPLASLTVDFNFCSVSALLPHFSSSFSPSAMTCSTGHDFKLYDNPVKEGESVRILSSRTVTCRWAALSSHGVPPEKTLLWLPSEISLPAKSLGVRLLFKSICRWLK